MPIDRRSFSLNILTTINCEVGAFGGLARLLKIFMVKVLPFQPKSKETRLITRSIGNIIAYAFTVQILLTMDGWRTCKKGNTHFYEKGQVRQVKN